MRKLRVLIGLAGSLLFLYLAFRGQDLGAIGAALKRANYWYVVPAIAVYFAGIWVRSLRWSFLLRPVERFSGRGLFRVLVIGITANNVLPLRSGELVRSYVLSTKSRVKNASALATIAVERIFDGLTMLGFVLVASLSIGLTSQVREVTIVGGVLFGTILVGLIVVSAGPARNWLIDSAARVLPERVGNPVSRAAHAFLDGLGILRSREDLILVCLTSVAAWVLEASVYALISVAFGLGLSPAAILLVTAVANLATLVPSSPGYVGAFEAGVVLALAGAVGVQHDLALSYA
ncbi:MAG: lysylphosphatidylglycerol synthase transmembrane domain-containing protein, partial [Nitrolancea sp.]